MFRNPLICIITIAMLVAQPVLAKGEGGNGGGNGQGNGGSGGKDGGGDKGHGNGGGNGGGNSGGRGGADNGNGSSGSREDGSKGGGNASRDGASAQGPSGQSNGNPGGRAGSEGRGSGANAGSGTGNAGSRGVGGAADTGGTSNPASSNGSGKTGATSAPASSDAARNAAGTAGLRGTTAGTLPTAVTPTPTSLRVRESSPTLALPPTLVPRLEASRSPTKGLVASFAPRANVPSRIVDTCRDTIASAARPYGAVHVDAISAGQASRTQNGGVMALLDVRVVYARANARQIRQSRVACQLNAVGAVVALR